MNIAIYSRKSKFTGVGDSVENQVQICKDYLKLNYKDIQYDITVYEDEGFSGKNVKRPMFKQMLNDINEGKINVMLCYRLDRVSRSVSDFSQLLDILQEHGVDFISVKESFDTSTPMGRAMISIASVFAQLERETIAERIKDSKIQVAKSGRWQGGNLPQGFKKERMSYVDADGKQRKTYYLIEDKDSKEYKNIKTMFEVMRKEKSITKVESYLMCNRIYTPYGNEYANSVINTILQNPIYAKNNACVYDYLIQQGCTISDEREMYDGKHGLIAYGKTGGEKRKRNSRSEWIVAIGKHKGMIDGENWVLIQEHMERNKLKYPRLQTSEVALFSGMIKCTCGAPMLVKGNRPDKYGNPSFYYKCYRKDRSHGELCSTDNIKGTEFDEDIVSKIKNMVDDKGAMNNDIKTSVKKLAQSKSEIQKNIYKLKEQIKEKESQAEQLVLKLAQASIPQSITDIVEKTLQKLSTELDELKQQLQIQNTQLSNINIDKDNLELITDRINYFVKNCDTATTVEKRDMLKSIIKSIQWDGTNYHIVLFTDLMTKN